MCCAKLVKGWVIPVSLQRELVMSGIGAQVPNHLLTKNNDAAAEKASDTSVSSSSEWVESLVHGPNAMVDSFAALHPYAKERFTVWNQYQNSRHINVGSRLDYIFVDRNLWDMMDPIPGSLDTGRVRQSYADSPKRAEKDMPDWMKHIPDETNSREMALSACTMAGRLQPAPSSGSGLPDGKPEEYLHHTMLKPHCGIIYFPPRWSDHVGVSMAASAMPVPQCGDALTPAEKRATRKCQPHRVQRSIASFFDRGKSSQSANTSLHAGRTEGTNRGSGIRAATTARAPIQAPCSQLANLQGRK